MPQSAATDGNMTGRAVTFAFNGGNAGGELCTGGPHAQTIHFDEDNQTEENISLSSGGIESGPNPPPGQVSTTVKQEENPDGTSQLCLGSSPAGRTFFFAENEQMRAPLG